MRWIPVALLAGPVLSVALHAQTVGPLAITGIATSARHCVSSNAANTHNLGWVAAQSGYTVEFDAAFGLAARIVRFEPTERRSSVVEGDPEFRYTASNSGTMVLHVSGNGEPGCYRYRALVDPPAALSTSGEPVSRSLERAAPVAERQSIAVAGPLAIAGNASSAHHCVAGNLVPNVHELGRVDRRSEVAVTFDTDFNAVVGATMISLEPNAGAGAFVVDPSSGTRTPSLSFTADPGENMVLYVAGFNGAAGCYKYKVEIR